MEVREIFFKLRTERSVGYGVNLPLTAVLLAPDCHTGIPGAEMTVIIGTKEDVQYDISFGNRTKETSHQAKKSSESVIGSMYLPSL